MYLGYMLATKLFIDMVSAIWSINEKNQSMGMLIVGHSHACSKAAGTLACAHKVENTLRPVNNLFPKKSHPQVAVPIIRFTGMLHFVVDQAHLHIIYNF